MIFGRIFFGLFLLVSGSLVAQSHYLSETGLYSNIQNKLINEDILSYSPQYPLWTDGALKERWIYLPPGERINTDDPDHWIFPIGTKLWKEFAFLNEEGQLKRVETRLIERLSDGTWQFNSYLWNELEDEAELAPSRGVFDYYPINSGVSHDIPSNSDCLTCHGYERIGSPVLGFDALQLSPEKDPNSLHADSLNPEDIDLNDLNLRQLVTRPFSSSSWPEISYRDENGNELLLQRTMLGYLHGNCSACHSADGSASWTNLNLKHSVLTESPREEVAFLNTVDQLSGFFTIPDIFPQETYLIRSSSVVQSAIHYRMSVRDFDQMPPFGSKIVDEEALTLLEQFILSLDD